MMTKVHAGHGSVSGIPHSAPGAYLMMVVQDFAHIDCVLKEFELRMSFQWQPAMLCRNLQPERVAAQSATEWNPKQKGGVPQ
eukprot:5056007-Amphidinium_carterae.1